MITIIITNNTSTDRVNVGFNEDMLQKFCTCTSGTVSFDNDGVEKRFHAVPELDLPVYEIMDNDGYKYLLVPFKAVGSSYEIQYFTMSWCSNSKTVFEKGILESLCLGEEFTPECLQMVLSNAEEHNMADDEFNQLTDAVNAHNTMMVNTFKA